MAGLDTTVFRSLTRPFRVAIYRRSPEFEEAVNAELAGLRLEAPNAPAELLRVKMLRDGVRATRRAVWQEAARRLAESGEAGETHAIGIAAAPRDTTPTATEMTPAKSRRSRIEAASKPQQPVDLSGISEALRTIALGGENRVLVSTPGGPGTLTEALQAFARAGLLSVEVAPDASGDPILVYRPLAQAPDIAPEPRSFS